MEILKRKDFARWQAAHRLSDEMLCKAVDEMCRGWSMRVWVVNCSKNAWQRLVQASAAVIEPFYPPASAIDVFSCTALPKVTRQISLWKNRKRCDSRAKSFWIYHR